MARPHVIVVFGQECVCTGCRRRWDFDERPPDDDVCEEAVIPSKPVQGRGEPSRHRPQKPVKRAFRKNEVIYSKRA